MTRLDCCCLRQGSLNELPNIRVVNLPEELSSALLSDITPTSTRSANDLPPIRGIFAFSFEDPDFSGNQRFSDQGFGPKRAMLFSARRREGNRKLHEIARILRSRISRDSEVSKRSKRRSKQSKNNSSEEDFERRKELKRALHRRLEEELLQDRTSSEDGYDADAIPIKTPNGTWGRNGGSGRYESGRLRPGVERFESTSPTLERGLHQQHNPSKHDGHRQASTSTKELQPEQSDQVLRLQKTSYNGLSEDKPIPGTHKNHLQIATPRQHSNTRQEFQSSDPDPPQMAQEHVRKEENVPNLKSSRSASFFDFRPRKDRNHSMVASRYRSMQNMKPNLDSTDAGNNSQTKDIKHLAERPTKWLRGPLRFLAPYAEVEDPQYHRDLQDTTCSTHESHRDVEFQDRAMGFDGVSDNEKNRVTPAVARRSVPQRSVSFSLEPVHEIRPAPDAVSKLLMPSKSLSQLDTRRQQVTDDNGSPHLHHVKTCHDHPNTSSGFTHLKVPDATTYPRRKVASSNYSSYNDSLASSRRSSLMRIQSLSERLDCIKNDPEPKKIPSAWSSALEIPRVSGSQFATSEIGDARRRISEAERLHDNARPVRAPSSIAEKSRSPSPQRSLVNMHTKPFYDDGIKLNRGIRRKTGYALKRESSERRSSSNLDGNDEWFPSSRRPGYGHDFVTPVYEDASSVWEKAFQDHADKDSCHSKRRLGSVSPARSRLSLETRVQVSKTRPARPRLKRGIEYSSSEFWKERLHPSYRVDLDQPKRKDASKPGGRKVSNSASPIPAASWSRFPSHTRAERSFSPAGQSDNVAARDFAPTFETTVAPSGQRKSKLFGFRKKRKSRTMTYGDSVMSTLNRFYSIDFRRLNRGHRSSISVGGRLEYPELEILPHLSPPAQPLDEASRRSIAMVLKAFHSNSSQQSIVRQPEPDNKPTISAGTWSKMYQDCVHYPVDMDESLVTDTMSVVSRARAVSTSSGKQETSPLSPRSSAELRTSTLNFQKSLQDNEAKAQERALQAADDAWGKSPHLRSSS
ncbi:hypothetical protein MMC07_005814 [Pseudocyphellaria aurata]|nr:hypothetical protein [Pseudocyphellaria aurata]